jgi:hypothetical protein
MSVKLEVTFADLQAEASAQAAKADVLTVKPTAQTAFVHPHVSLDYVNIYTGLSFVDMKASVGYVSMLMTDIILDSSIRLYWVTDTISFIDAVSFTFDFGLTPSDAVTPADAVAVSVAKSITDQFFFADAIVVTWTPIRQFDETVTASDSVGVVFAMGALADTATVADALVLELGRLLEDTFSAADGVAWLMEKAASDGISAADAAVLDIGKALAESLSMSDNVGVLNTSIESSVPNHSVLGTFMLNH